MLSRLVLALRLHRGERHVLHQGIWINPAHWVQQAFALAFELEFTLKLVFELEFTLKLVLVLVLELAFALVLMLVFELEFAFALVLELALTLTLAEAFEFQLQFHLAKTVRHRNISFPDECGICLSQPAMAR
jgi:hypothetical protein